MPEKSFFGRRPPFPLCNKDVRIVIGDPIEFDLTRLRQTAKSMSRELPFPSVGWPDSSTHGLNAAAQQWLYTNISDRIRNVMQSLRSLADTLTKVRVWGGYFAFTSPKYINAIASQMTFWFKFFWVRVDESLLLRSVQLPEFGLAVICFKCSMEGQWFFHVETIILDWTESDELDLNAVINVSVTITSLPMMVSLSWFYNCWTLTPSNHWMS